jgi:hypothetical protein
VLHYNIPTGGSVTFIAIFSYNMIQGGREKGKELSGSKKGGEFLE